MTSFRLLDLYVDGLLWAIKHAWELIDAVMARLFAWSVLAGLLFGPALVGAYFVFTSGPFEGFVVGLMAYIFVTGPVFYAVLQTETIEHNE